MAIARYYIADPRITGPAEFLAGFGTATRQGRMQGIQYQAEANRVVGTGIGTAIGQGFAIPAQEMMRDRSAQRQTDQQLAVQEAISKRQEDLERIRQQGDIYQTSVNAYVKRFGEMPPMTAAAGAAEFGGQIPAMPTPQQYDQSGALGPPSIPTEQPPVPQEGVPLPSIDPGATKAYQKASELKQQIMAAKAALDTNPFMPANEKAAIMATWAPYLAEATKITSQYQQPKPPNAMDIVNGGNIAPIPGYDNAVITDPATGESKVVTLHPQKAGSQLRVKVRPPDGSGEQELGVGAYTFTTADGSLIGLSVDPDGKQSWSKLMDASKGAGGGAPDEDYVKLAERRLKETRPRDSEGHEQAESDPVKVQREIDVTAFRIEIDRIRGKTLTPEEYQAIVQRVAERFGNDPGKVPKALYDDLYELGRPFRVRER